MKPCKIVITITARLLNRSHTFTRNEYRMLRNLVNRELKCAKSSYFCDLISKAKGDSSKLWKAVNEASARNSKSSIP